MLIMLSLSLLAGAVAADAGADAFNEGKMLMGKTKYDEACDAFERAEKAGYEKIKTRYWLGRCNEERKQYANAYRAFHDTAQLAEEAGDSKRAAAAHKRAKELEQKFPMIILTVPPSVRVEGLTIKRDGEVVPAEMWGKPLAVEPGKHTIEITAPGMKPLTLKITADKPGQKAALAMPALTPGDPAGDAGARPVDDGAKPGDGGVPVGGDGGTNGGDEGPETKKRSAGLFWTGMGLTILGGLAALGTIGYIAGEVDPDPQVGVMVTGFGIATVGLGVGLPFMFVFGVQVPVEPEEKEALIVEPLIGPTGAGLRLRF